MWTDETKSSESIVNRLISKFCLLGPLIEKIKFTANAKISMQVTPCTAAMQKLYTSYMHGSFFCHLLICHHSINTSKCSKYCN